MNTYKCNRNVTFGKSEIVRWKGNETNIQDVILEGKVIGFLEETSWFDLTRPMEIRFVIPLMDNIPKEYKDHPNFSRDCWDEFNELHFNSLQELVDCWEKYDYDIPMATEG